MNIPFFHRLRLHLELEIENVELRLRRLAAGDFPTDVAKDLIGVMREDLRNRRTTVNQIVNAYDVDPLGAFQRLQSEHRKLLILLPYITFIENAQTQRVPWSLVPSFERLAASLMPGRKLLTTCATDFNYTITFSLNPNSGGGIADFDVLELPAVHRVNAFLHVVVGHELFHPILDDFFKLEQPQVYANIRMPCSTFLKSQQPTGTLFDAKRLDEMVEATARAWRRAIEELMCDMGCAAVFGPAALLSFHNMMLCTTLDQTPTYPSLYPPGRFRLRTVFKFAFDKPEGQKAIADLFALLQVDPSLTDLLDAGAQLEEQMRLIRDLTNDRSDVNKLRSFPLLKIAYDEVDRVLESAWAYIIDRIEKADIATWIKVLSEIKPHLCSLKMSVPSGEIRQPGDVEGPPGSIAAITLAAWLNELHCERTQIQQKKTERLGDYLIRCRLLLKSIEDSELKRDYIDRKRRAVGHP